MVRRMAQKETTVPDGYEEVFSKWITRNGKRIPPPKGKKVWRFLARKKAA